jgi:hypothetical protein
MPRLHGFHRFLPHLWELFYCATGGTSACWRPDYLSVIFAANWCWQFELAIGDYARSCSAIKGAQDELARLNWSDIAAVTRPTLRAA